MLHRFFSPVVFMVVVLSLFACAVQEKIAESELQPLDKAGSPQEYSAWRESGLTKSPAVTGLLMQIDELISNKNFRTAESKLERLLRIAPNYAPAWSRMAWLALQTNNPKRAKQMASRSNSFIKSNLSLKKLNWTFIRDASEKMHDQQGVRQAQNKIESLEAAK